MLRLCSNGHITGFRRCPMCGRDASESLRSGERLGAGIKRTAPAAAVATPPRSVVAASAREILPRRGLSLMVGMLGALGGRFPFVLRRGR